MREPRRPAARPLPARGGAPCRSSRYRSRCGRRSRTSSRRPPAAGRTRSRSRSRTILETLVDKTVFERVVSNLLTNALRHGSVARRRDRGAERQPLPSRRPGLRRRGAARVHQGPLRAVQPERRGAGTRARLGPRPRRSRAPTRGPTAAISCTSTSSLAARASSSSCRSAVAVTTVRY